MVNKIRDLAEKRSLSIAKLEQALEFGNGTIYKWKTSSPTADKIKKVAEYLGTTVDELLKED